MRSRLPNPSGTARSLIFVAALFSFVGSAWSQIGLVHVTPCGPGAFPGLTCTIPATGSGNLLVVAWESTNNGSGATVITSIVDNVNNVFSEAGNAKAVDAGPNTMADLWYAKNSRSGATVLTIAPNPSGTLGSATIWEFSGVDTTAPLDQTGVLNSQAATTTPSGAPGITTSGGELVVSIISVGGTVAGVFSGNAFTNDSTANGNGWAHLITSSPGTYTAKWNASPSGTYLASTVSFKAAGSGTALNACDLNQDGLVNFADVQLAVNMDLGMVPCTANIAGAGVCTVVVVQRVSNAANGVIIPHSATLSWTPSTSLNVAGYNVYRATTSGGPYTKLNSSLVAGVSYTDASVQSGQTYFYVATAVDTSNNESLNSNEAQAAIPLGGSVCVTGP
jgi:hypothetical protein